MALSKRFVLKILFFLAVHIFVGINFYYMSVDTVKGNLYSEKIFGKTRYPSMRIPKSNNAIESHATNRISADFAQIYFPARFNQSSAYTYETDDPWMRPSRYAPLIHYIFKYTLCKLQYGYASLINILFQLLLFYLSIFFVLKQLNIEKYYLSLLILFNIILFLTPVGLSWFERGQFSLYVANAYLWLLIGIIKSNKHYIIISSIFAFFKWTSFPFIFIVFILSFFNAKTYNDFKNIFFNAVVFSFTIFILFIFSFKEGIAFISGIIEQEKYFNPQGLSLGVIFPIANLNFIQIITCISIG